MYCSGVFRLPGQKSVFAAWILAQKWKVDSSSRNGFILADLSNKVESIQYHLSMMLMIQNLSLLLAAIVTKHVFLVI
jgi:hypothetical protein